MVVIIGKLVHVIWFSETKKIGGDPKQLTDLR